MIDVPRSGLRLADTLGAAVHTIAPSSRGSSAVVIVLPEGTHAYVEIFEDLGAIGATPTFMVPMEVWRVGIDRARASRGKFVVLAAYREGDLAYVCDQRDVEQRIVWFSVDESAGPVIHIPKSLMVPVL